MCMGYTLDYRIFFEITSLGTWVPRGRTLGNSDLVLLFDKDLINLIIKIEDVVCRFLMVPTLCTYSSNYHM